MRGRRKVEKRREVVGREGESKQVKVSTRTSSESSSCFCCFDLQTTGQPNRNHGSEGNHKLEVFYRGTTFGILLLGERVLLTKGDAFLYDLLFELHVRVDYIN